MLKNAASPKGSGYWTGPLWPINGSQTKGTAPGFEPDPGCPDGGCLFNLRLDRTEHKEFSSEQPELRARMAARMVRRHHALHLIRFHFLHGRSINQDDSLCTALSIGLLDCAVLCCTVLCCAVLCCAVLRCV